MQWRGVMATKQGCAWLRQGDEMTVCDSDEGRVYVADNAGASATAELRPHLGCAMGRLRAQALLGSLKVWRKRKEGECQQWLTHLCHLS